METHKPQSFFGWNVLDDVIGSQWTLQKATPSSLCNQVLGRARHEARIDRASTFNWPVVSSSCWSSSTLRPTSSAVRSSSDVSVDCSCTFFSVSRCVNSSSSDSLARQRSIATCRSASRWRISSISSWFVASRWRSLPSVKNKNEFIARIRWLKIKSFQQHRPFLLTRNGSGSYFDLQFTQSTCLSSTLKLSLAWKSVRRCHKSLVFLLGWEGRLPIFVLFPWSEWFHELFIDRDHLSSCVWTPSISASRVWHWIKSWRCSVACSFNRPFSCSSRWCSFSSACICNLKKLWLFKVNSRLFTGCWTLINQSVAWKSVLWRCQYVALH